MYAYVVRTIGCRLGAAGGCTIAAALRRHRTLTRLDLSGNLVLPEGGRALSLALSALNHSALAHLDLSCNKMGGAAGKVTRHCVTVFGAVL
jgi:Leucine Rich repeat